ncbi:hypothetical protein [Pseudoalteromonas rubra]|uniref:hypothetical protein n=1 Tax=Pseudoalteromonas rubra TaxID=43658 RepID=UPI002DBA0FB7|nr:hypothetical protein [Pseudoalteromonas rubra]MEC4090577.1 hypothetical protein [Pseudoalteromonas rubra]
MIKADSNGQIRGRFLIPGNVPVGSKDVRFIGEKDSMGQARYTGNATIRSETVRRINSIVTVRYDPLAQTFTLPERRFMAAVELWFKKTGKEAVRVQIRETELGIPNQTVLAEATLEQGDIKLGGEPTLFEFTPVSLNAGEEYAIVVLTDGDEHEVAIAELGKFDSDSGWVTSQPYQVGVLLSSSNASTWTPHQNRDLAFRLKAARFTQTESQVALGEVALDGHTDLLALAVAERPGSDTQLQLEFSGESTGTFSLQELQSVRLANKATEIINVSARLTGTETQSPVLFESVQAALGTVAEQADYVTRAIPCEVDGSLKVSFEAQLPGVAKVTVLIEQGDSWLEVPLKSTQAADEGWQLCHYQLDSLTERSARVKLLLSGSHTERPRVRALRAFSI